MLGWYTGPEKRWLRRPKKDLSNQKMGSANQQLSYHPDVYPQENNQKEDAMTAELLTNGYQLQVLPMEYGIFCIPYLINLNCHLSLICRRF